MANITLFPASTSGSYFSPVLEFGTSQSEENLIPFIDLKAPDLKEVYKDFFLPIWNFDATTSESHQHSAEVTNHPVERGVDITDHIQLKPFRLTLQGIVTNTPLKPGVASSATRTRELYESLVDLFESKSILNVVTGLKRYTNMVITSVTVPREAPNRQHIIPSVELVQINTVEQAFVALESLGIPKKAKPKQEKTAETVEYGPIAKQEKQFNRSKETTPIGIVRNFLEPDYKLLFNENIAAGTQTRAINGIPFPAEYTGSTEDLEGLGPLTVGANPLR